MASGSVVPTFRKPRKVGQPLSWWRKGGPASESKSQVVYGRESHPLQRTQRMGHPAMQRFRPQEAGQSVWMLLRFSLSLPQMLTARACHAFGGLLLG